MLLFGRDTTVGIWDLLGFFFFPYREPGLATFSPIFFRPVGDWEGMGGFKKFENLVGRQSSKFFFHLEKNQLMVNCWFGSRWFGIPGLPLTIPFIFGNPRNPNHRKPKPATKTTSWKKGGKILEVGSLFCDNKAAHSFSQARYFGAATAMICRGKSGFSFGDILPNTFTSVAYGWRFGTVLL